jgi:RimJ/RimL family protein N-acetyltransferase
MNHPKDTAPIAAFRNVETTVKTLGTALVSTLLDAAEERGFDRFVATIAADNSIIRRLLNRFGPIGGCFRLAKSLGRSR